MTVRGGWIASHTPMLWVIGGGVIVALGGLGRLLATGFLTRILMTHAPTDGTYYVVDHLHYTLGLAMAFGFFAAWYYLFPKLTGYAYSDLLGRIHFGMLCIGVVIVLVSITLVPQIFLLASTTQHVADVAEALRYSNLLARVGSYIAAASTLVFLANMVLAFVRRRSAD